MIEMHFKASEDNRAVLDKLNYAMREALAGSPSFQKGDEMFITSVEKIPEGYGFIAYFGADGTEAPILVFEDCSVTRITLEGKKKIV